MNKADKVDSSAAQRSKSAEKHSTKLCIADRLLNYLTAGLEKLNIRPTTKERAMELYRMVRGELIVSNSNPRVFAAVIAYYSCLLEREFTTQKEVLSAFGLKNPTILSTTRSKTGRYLSARILGK